MLFESEKYIKLIQERKLDEALKFKKSCMPKKIYKYISLSDAYTCGNNKNKLCEINSNLNNLKFKALSNDEIWLSRFDNLNDPYEYKGIYLNSEELIKAGWTINYIEEYFNKIKSILLTCSFSTNLVDNMPMWAHYSNNHKGFCVEYEVVDAQHIYPISYKKERIGISSIPPRIIKMIYKIVEEKRNERDKEFQFYMTLITHFALLKHTSWSYENEYRILFTDLEWVNRGTNVSAIDVGLKVSKIYIGSECLEASKKILIDIARSIDVDTYQMYLSDNETEYKLSYKAT